LARIVENPVSRRPAFPRPWPASWLVLGAFILGAGSGFGATDPVLKPLPKNRAFDGYASRAEFLQHTAAFESERLRRAGFRTEAEPAHWARARFTVTLAPGLELGFVKIPGATFVDGITAGLKEKIFATPNRAGDLRRWENSVPDRIARVEVPYDFFMSEVIVTQGMFAAFVRETNYRTTVSRYQTGWIVTKDAQWLQGFANEFDQQVPPLSARDHPVVQVSWFDAMQFAAWLSRKAGVMFRVPTKDEWSLAGRPIAQLATSCVFPWGNDFTGLERRMNFASRELDYMWVHDQFADGHAFSSPVKAYPADSRGLHDMVGNVWVWNWENAAQYEARPSGDRTTIVAALEELDVARNQPISMQGGCYLARLSHAHLLSKMSHPALDGAEDIGFRLVAVRAANSGFRSPR
jgi:formylglycine-generating enzyme required for sulfatase activity